MTTVRHVSQCCSLRYSFSFSHKCPGLVRVHDCNLRPYAKTQITMAVTLCNFSEFGKPALQKTICGGIYARVYCIFLSLIHISEPTRPY